MWENKPTLFRRQDSENRKLNEQKPVFGERPYTESQGLTQTMRLPVSEESDVKTRTHCGENWQAAS